MDEKLLKKLLADKLENNDLKDVTNREPHISIPEIITYNQTDSTNERAKALAKEKKCPVLVTADTQTAGKGRLGRNFYSPDKTGAYFSLVIKGTYSVSNWLKFTSLAAVCVCRAIEKICNLKPLIKWVNDVYVDDGKVCGILTESIFNEQGEKIEGIIIGIGINLNTSEFPSNLPNPASIGYNAARENVIAEITANILEEAPYIAQNKHVEYYKNHSYLTGKQIVWFNSNEKRFGLCTGITDECELTVKTPEGEIVNLCGGEVSVRITE